MLLCPSVQRHEPVFPAQCLHHPSCCVPLRFLSALLLLEIWAQAKGVSYFKAVSWDFFFPSSKFVICFLPEHFLFHLCLDSDCDANRTCSRHCSPYMCQAGAAVGTHCPGAGCSPVCLNSLSSSLCSCSWSLEMETSLYLLVTWQHQPVRREF